MAYSPVAKQRLQAYRSETPEERAARHRLEHDRRRELRQDARLKAKRTQLAAMRLAMWYREQGRT